MIVPIILALVAMQRIAEVAYAEHNTRALLARGGIEIAPEQHRWFVLLHASWLIAMALLIPWNARANWWLLGAFAILQLARLWVLFTLGPYWTTKVITVPTAPLVRRGPYRFFKHPNYAIVVAEIAVLPLAFGAWQIALAFSMLNAMLLGWRLRAENAALAARSTMAP